MTLPNFKLKIVAKEPTCADATAVLKDTANNTILTEAIPSGATENITAPNATVTLNGGAFQTPRSNQTIDVLTRDQNNEAFAPSVSGLTLSFDRYDEIDLYMAKIGSTDATWRAALRAFKAGCIADGIWGKPYYINPILGGSAATHAIPLIGGTPLTFFGSITHASTGMTGNGTNGYYALDVTHPMLSQNNHSIFVYLRTNIAQDSGDIGYIDISGNGTQIATRVVSGNFNSRSYSAFDSTANTDSRRVMGVSRVASGEYRIQRDGSQNLITRASTTVGLTVGTLLANRITGMVVSQNGVPIVGNYSTREQSFIWVGEGLTSGEMTSLTNRIGTLQTALSRNV